MQRNQQVIAAIARYPKTFQVTTYEGTFSIDRDASYVNDAGDVQLVITRKNDAGAFVQFLKCYTAELDDFIKLSPAPVTVIFHRIGDFYEVFGESAKIAAKVLQLTVTRRRDSDEPMCGIPYHSAPVYVERLRAAGYAVDMGDDDGRTRIGNTPEVGTDDDAPAARTYSGVPGDDRCERVIRVRLETPMTVAELKRRIQPGTKLRSVYVGPNSSMFTPEHPFYTETATVRRVMSTQFTVNRPYKGADSESFCTFPKASQLSATPNGFRITSAPNMILEYVWVDA